MSRKMKGLQCRQGKALPAGWDGRITAIAGLPSQFCLGDSGDPLGQNTRVCLHEAKVLTGPRRRTTQKLKQVILVLKNLVKTCHELCQTRARVNANMLTIQNNNLHKLRLFMIFSYSFNHGQCRAVTEFCGNTTIV